MNPGQTPQQPPQPTPPAPQTAMSPPPPPPSPIGSSGHPLATSRVIVSVVTIIVIFAIIVTTIVTSIAVTKNKNKTSSAASDEAWISQPRSSTQSTEQKNEISQMIASINEYTANNNGMLPSSTTQLQSALEGYYVDRGSEYALAYKSSYSSADLPTNERDSYYFAGYTCDKEETIRAGTSRQFAVAYVTAGGTQRCVTN